MKVYLCVHGKPFIHGEKIRAFVHHPQLEPNCYVWENRALSVEEHNAVARKVVDANADLRPYTRIVVETPKPAPKPVGRNASPVKDRAELSPV